MAALMRKEFYLIGKQIWSLIAVALLLSFSPQLESLGSSYLMVLAITLPMTTMAYDERCHWDTYLAMTPCRPEKIVCSKYLFAAGLTVAAMGIGLLTSFIQAASAHSILIEMLAEKIGVLMTVVTVNAITLPTVFRFGAEKGRLTMMAVMLAIFAVIVGGAKLIGEEGMFGWIDAAPPVPLWIAGIAVFAAVNIASFFLSVRLYRKRQAGAYD